MTNDAQNTLIPPPYFDGRAARCELTALFNANASAAEARVQVLECLKTIVKNARNAAQAALEVDGNGRRCAAGLNLFQDELIRLVYDYTVRHVYRATNPSDAERMAVVATGGYGRGLLAPGSDIDLLFLLPYKQTPWGESVAEYVLYLLWDLGFKVGHATRTVDQCLKYGQSDMTVRTALLDARLILGDAQLFAEFEQRFRSEVVKGSARQFIDAKMSERDERTRRAGESRYKVEPNIKDGKGGLRDLHTLQWLSKYIFGQEVGTAAVEAGIFTPEEVQTFRRCEDFLWRVRCFLHFLTGRAEEVLSFEVQPAMAQSLGYTSRGGMRAVERFMKHYFLIAKDVGDLTTILCGALEMQQLKTTPRYRRLLSPLNWKMRREVRQRTDFRIDNDRLNVADPEVFTRDPVNLIRYFAHAATTDTYLHPDAIRLLRASLRLIDDNLRHDPEANQIFLSLLTAQGNPEVSLRHMNEAGVLGRFVPEFGRIVAMMQFNMYHHYTVDEHLLRTLGNVAAIERGELAAELPLSTAIFSSIQNRRALFIAAFLHDIGKGRKENHSIVGTRIARKLCPRLGMTAAETELVAWLIKEHLTMSNFAHSRDIADPETIRAFANIVQSPERLKLLLVLTCADIMAVGPGVWNGWKGQLLAHALSRNGAAGRGRPYANSEKRADRAGPSCFAQRAIGLAGTRSQRFHRPSLCELLVANRSWDADHPCAGGPRRHAVALEARDDGQDRLIHSDHRPNYFCAKPRATAGPFCRFVRSSRRQYRRRPHYDHAGRLCPRHVPAQSRVSGGRGRVAASRPHFEYHPTLAQWSGSASGAATAAAH